MAMSTMLHHENPPLRNESPVDLATTSPVPGRSGEVSDSSCYYCLIPRHTTSHNYRKSASFTFTNYPPTIGFII